MKPLPRNMVWATLISPRLYQMALDIHGNAEASPSSWPDKPASQASAIILAAATAEAFINEAMYAAGNPTLRPEEVQRFGRIRGFLAHLRTRDKYRLVHRQD